MGIAKTVVIGGGTGAPVSIRALLSLNMDVSAVVAMADDGGSSGLLREYPGILPPGDIRKCLVSMASDPNSEWVQAFTRRLAYDSDHPLGNLMLSTLSEVTGSLPRAIELCGELLGIRGRVLPSTLESVELIGMTTNGQKLTGQANLTHSDCAMHSVSLKPKDPQPYTAALEAINAAQMIILGPGSLFTSVIPNLLVPGVVDAIQNSKALTLFICSLADMQGEAWGMDAVTHVEALLRHGMANRLDYVVINESEPLPDSMRHIRRVSYDAISLEYIRSLGIRVVVEPMVDPLRPTWHDVNALADVFTGIFFASQA
ncbi:MAG: YvcK family protein [Coriobacteriales bacterium]|nr:YvcK family protein [Coriobacteriales bacterium]